MKNIKHIVKTALFCGVLALIPVASVLQPRESTSYYGTVRWRLFRC